jgi:thiol-disulfide isomerase/thioredoxin
MPRSFDSPNATFWFSHLIASPLPSSILRARRIALETQNVKPPLLPNNRRQYLMALVCATCVNPAFSADAKRLAWTGRAVKPTLQLFKQSGGMWSLSDQKGKPLLLNFWASWCEPCRSEMPSLEILAKRYEARGLQVLAVNYKESESVVQRFIDTTALRLPVLRDTGEIAKIFGVHIFPSTLAINRKGEVLFTVVGECDWSSPTADRWIAEML